MNKYAHFLVNKKIKFTFYLTNLPRAKHEFSELANEPKLAVLYTEWN